MNKARLWFCAAVMLMLLMPGQALAAEASASVSLPVTQSVTVRGTAKATDAVVDYTFQAADPMAPMPQGSENSKLQFQMKGDARFQIPTITFASAGIWEYTLTATYRGQTLSPAPIQITVYVQGDPGALAVTSIAKLNNGEKTELLFQPVVQGATPATPSTTSTPGVTPKTGDDRAMTLVFVGTLMSFCIMVCSMVSLRRDKKNCTESKASDHRG